MKPEATIETVKDPEITVRPLEERDLTEADQIVRLAFGTFIGLPDPTTFMGDGDYVRTRWFADPRAAFAAESKGKVVGSNFATNWGSIGFFGPLTIHPDFWDRGVGKRLMEPIMECFANWGTCHAGLFTFPHSAKHLGLYQKFGFWPRFLTAIMSKPIGGAENNPPWTTFAAVAAGDRKAVLDECRALTNSIYEGLDVVREIVSVADQNLGDTILVREGSTLVGVAVCHIGPGTEAGSGTCYVKFGAARPDAAVVQNFGRLIEACEQLAASRESARLVAGVNTAREAAYREMLRRGFRSNLQGVVMSRPNEEGYNRPGVYLIDDWR
ncbi:MAG TPA: GNAT family N-acetyltransferase [Pyrinomonadaceae bacterium]|nr:GNAT family N-acetyltransferase [Pyrinomonadaceae bacterium]